MASPAETTPHDTITPHPYLTGLHTPMTAELTIENLAVTGTIPPALDGRYLRMGPNPIAADPRNHHWFAGDGMAHGLRLADGRAHWYRNRWVRSARVTQALGETHTPGPRHGESDTVNTSVMGLAGQTWALIEAGSTPVLLGERLESLAYDDFAGTLRGAFSAHPHIDPETGEAHAIAYDGHQPTLVHHVVVGTDGRVRREEPIAVADGPSIHDCALTARFVLVLDLPVTLWVAAAEVGQPFPYRWNPAHRARVGLLPRVGAGRDVTWCEVDPCYVFHVANAYDTADGRVVLDAVVHDAVFADDTPQGPVAQATTFERWTIDPASRSVRRTVIDATPQEFPRIDERRFGSPCRYVYTVALPEQDGTVAGTNLLRHDLVAGTRACHAFGPGRHPGEFAFVPAHATAAEDEGWLIGLVINAAEETTDLVILDAAAFTGPPAASIRIPHRIPPGFHGAWLPTTI